MNFRLALLVMPLLVCAPAIVGCDADEDPEACDPLNSDCSAGLVCEVLIEGGGHCFAPLTVAGRVLDAEEGTPIEGALVAAVDPNGAAIGASDRSGPDGRYQITVPTARDAEGRPVSGGFTLRAQAALYQPFPTAIRPALALDTAGATGDAESGWLLENTATDIELLRLPGDTSGLGSIEGRVLAELHAGVLVVAEAGGAGVAGFSDSAGDYTVFNAPAGSYTVRGYLAGVQLEPAETTLAAGEHKTGVDLDESAAGLGTVSGHLQIVNPEGGTTTSVVLAVESTFEESVGRGEVPPGLRAGEVTTDFLIEGVPAGRYVVLAAFENDGLVRDPDQTIGGTQIVHIEVPDPILGLEVDLPEGFKITGALEVFSPGADGPEEIDSLTPTLRWADDSSEDGFEVRVIDAFGQEVWTAQLGPVSGGGMVEIPYAGPALKPGMFYQFRATSFRDKGGVWTAISTTEDLRGVFVPAPPAP